MDFIQNFLFLNHDIFLFVYGLVFFVLGLAVAVQSRGYSRLDLARSLKWLSAFGFSHGLYEWGDVFVPIQAGYLSAPAIQFLNVLQLVLLAVSFAFLFEFGIALMRPFGRMLWLHGVSAGLLVAWVIVIFFIILPTAPDLESWRQTANALARYFIGFPGGLLAAYGLRQHALRRIAVLNVPRITNTLRVAGVTLFFYSIAGGLIVPPVSFFPGNLINTDTFTMTFGFPPLILRSLIGLVLSISVIRAMEVFDVETDRMVEAMEQGQILAAERERIARDLHDGAIQSVYTAGLLVESASRLADPDSQVAARLSKAVTVLNDAIRDMRRSLFDLKAETQEEQLAVALARISNDPRFTNLVKINLDLDLPEGNDLPPGLNNQIMAIVGEALSNIIRHAHADRVKISARQVDDRLLLTISDDGVGMPQQPENGYGLRNMRDRARLLDGDFNFTSDAGKGTTIKLDIPWKDINEKNSSNLGR